MKDLIAKLKSDACMAMGGIWLHIDAREARIAELEAENTNLRYELNAALSGGTVSCPAADTDKLREFERFAPEIVSIHEGTGYHNEVRMSPKENGNWVRFTDATAMQAPVREVPGYKLVPLEVTDAMLEAWKNELCIPVGSSPEAKARRAYKAMLAAAPLPADPVQEPKP